MFGYARTAMLLAALTALFMGAGFLLGGMVGMAVVLVFAVGTNLFAYWNSDQMVLRTYGARPVDRAIHPEFYDMVAALALARI